VRLHSEREDRRRPLPRERDLLQDPYCPRTRGEEKKKKGLTIRKSKLSCFPSRRRDLQHDRRKRNEAFINEKEITWPDWEERRALLLKERYTPGLAGSLILLE